MAAALKKYCKDVEYKKQDFKVLFYNQDLAVKKRTILTDLEHNELPIPLVEVTPARRSGRHQVENPVVQSKRFEPLTINKDSLVQIIKNIYIHTCVGIVSQRYLEDQFSHNTILMILFDTSDNTASETIPSFATNDIINSLGKPVCFILGHINNTDDTGADVRESYIDIICACPGSGRYLLEYFIEYSENNGFTAVSLSALPNVLAYYPRFGFSHRHSCQAAYTERPAIAQKRAAIIQKGKHKIKMTEDELYEDDDYFEFLKELRSAEFGRLKDDCDGILTKKKLKDGRCDNDGYMMRRCRQ